MWALCSFQLILLPLQKRSRALLRWKQTRALAATLCLTGTIASAQGDPLSAIDWLSRMRPNPFSGGKPLMLLSTSPGSGGGVRGLWQTRVPLEGIGAYVCPDMYYLPNGHEELGEDRLRDAAKQEALQGAIANFLRAAKALNNK